MTFKSKKLIICSSLIQLYLIFIISSLTILVLAEESKEDSLQDPVYLKTSNLGWFIGNKNVTAFSNRPFYQFIGIPYAKPPLGELRFKAPLPFKEWSGKPDEEHNVRKYGNECPQLGYASGLPEGDEDCLTANIFSPEIQECDKDHKCTPKKDKKLLPVIVWIHGGSFQYESGNVYRPNYLLEEDIVLVTFNYRIGILGFASTDSKIIQGNQGLKDQVLLLKWVQEHIKDFNGDPDNVTIMGASTGGTSVHLHMLSPMSKNLFHRAVSQSGTAISHFALLRAPTSRNRLLHFSKVCECPFNTTEIKEMVECIKKLDAKTIVQNQLSLQEWFIDPLCPTGPVIELEGDEEKFLPENPFKMILDGKFAKDIPWVLGVNAQEGLLHSADIVNNGILQRVFDIEWDKAAPITFNYQRTTFDPLKVTESIREFYFQKMTTHLDKSQIEAITNLYSDRYFFHPNHHAARVHTKFGNAPIYLYYFNYRGQDGLIQQREISKDFDYGISHYDQLQYFFEMPYFNKLSNDHKDAPFAKKVISTLVNFAKTGIPGTEEFGYWTPVTKAAAEGDELLKYNIFGTSKETLIEEPFNDRIKFWDQLPLMEMWRDMDVIKGNIPDIEKIIQNNKTNDKKKDNDDNDDSSEEDSSKEDSSKENSSKQNSKKKDRIEL